jgi:hypothetical protein
MICLGKDGTCTGYDADETDDSREGSSNRHGKTSGTVSRRGSTGTRYQLGSIEK